MKGTRPLDNNEIRLVWACFDGTLATRNRGLFMLGVSTGGRISELLSLRIGDVYQNGKAVTDLLFDKSIVKGGELSRAVPVNVDGRHAIEDLICWHRGTLQNARSVASFIPLAKQARIRRDEQANRTRDAQESLRNSWLERKTGDTLKHYERKLRREQRKLSKKVFLSNNWYKQKRRVERIHYRIACIRSDAQQKTTTEVVNRASAIGIETLKVTNLLKNRNIAKALLDSALGRFLGTA